MTNVTTIGPAIITKYLGPTNTRGSRITAKSVVGTITISWDYSLSTTDNHKAAIAAFIVKYNWGDATAYCYGWLGDSMVAARDVAYIE